VTWVSLHDPRELGLSFLLLEVGFLTWGALTLVHALRSRDPAARLTWLTIFLYGLAMELGSYAFVDNFAHGRFTVMLYDEQLPLYIVATYPVLLYTGIALARSLRLPRLQAAIASGILIVAIDVPFDLAGPHFGWWRWFDNDPNIAYRWSGVPVTSFYWHLTFGGILAYLTARGGRLRYTPLYILGTIGLGIVAFLPFHGLKSLGVSDGAIVGAALTAAAACTIASVARRR
jgi:hypothetical protein